MFKRDVLKLLRLRPVNSDYLTVVKVNFRKAAVQKRNGAKGAIGEFTGGEPAIHEFSIDKAAAIKGTLFIRDGLHCFIRKCKPGEVFLIIGFFRKGHAWYYIA